MEALRELLKYHRVERVVAVVVTDAWTDITCR